MPRLRRGSTSSVRANVRPAVNASRWPTASAETWSRCRMAETSFAAPWKRSPAECDAGIAYPLPIVYIASIGPVPVESVWS